MPARCRPSTSASRAAHSSYIDDLFCNTAADTRFESALFDQIHRSAEKFGEVPFKPEETKDPRHLGELDQNVHVASLVLLAAPARPEDTDGPDVVGLLQVCLLLPENADDPRTFPAGLAGDGIHS